MEMVRMHWVSTSHVRVITEDPTISLELTVMSLIYETQPGARKWSDEDFRERDVVATGITGRDRATIDLASTEDSVGVRRRGRGGLG